MKGERKLKYFVINKHSFGGKERGGGGERRKEHKERRERDEGKKDKISKIALKANFFFNKTFAQLYEYFMPRLLILLSFQFLSRLLLAFLPLPTSFFPISFCVSILTPPPPSTFSPLRVFSRENFKFYSNSVSTLPK